jgi:hypothetical protein
MTRVRKSRGDTGIILLVCLALLTLFSIVGLAFVAYSEREAAASQSWRVARFFEQTQDAAPVVVGDLLEALQGDFDFTRSHEGLARLGDEAVELRDLVCSALEEEKDPEKRREIERLCVTLHDLADAIDRLEEFIRLIELRLINPPR